MAIPKSAIIIGAGAGGLATAALLAKAGCAVTLLEQHTKPGGRAGIIKKDGFTFDTGPSWYLMPEVFEHYFSLLNEDLTHHLQLVQLDPAYKVFFEFHSPVSVRSDLQHAEALFNSIEPNSGVAMRAYLARAQATYTLAMNHFLYTNFSRPWQLFHPDVIKALPALGRMLGMSLHNYVSKFVNDIRLQQILEYPMVFLGTSPFKAPAMYSLMSHLDFTQGVLYPKGGLYNIILALERVAVAAGVVVRYDTPVATIRTSGKKATGVQLQNGTVLRAEAVISNADLQYTETELLPYEAQTYPKRYWDKRTPGPSALLMYLGVKGSLSQLQHHNLFFANKWRENFKVIEQGAAQWPHPASMYVCKPSHTDSTVAPAGHENVFVLVPIPANIDMPDIETHADMYLRQLADMAGIPNLQSHIVTRTFYGPQDFASKLHAWRGTALGLAHTFNQSAFMRPANKSRKLDNLYYVGGNTVPGIGLPMCLIGAEILYKRLKGDLSAGPLESL